MTVKDIGTIVNGFGTTGDVVGTNVKALELM